MRIPGDIAHKLEEAAKPPRILRRWQLSLRTLFILTTICGLFAWFHEPLWAYIQSIWEIWFPRYDPNRCGPCGMG